MNDMLNYLKGQTETIKEDLLTLVKAESPSDKKEFVDLCGEKIKLIFFKRLGKEWKLTVHERKESGNHLLFEEKEPSGPRVLLLSHFDTVWDIGELPIKEQDQQIYGPGVFDMKAGLLSSIWAIHALIETHRSLPISPVFLFTADEEVGSSSSKELIEETAKTCVASLIFEPPIAHTNSLKTARKGGGEYKIEVFGKKAHAGNDHQNGVSAIHELAEQIIQLENLTNYEKGTTVTVGKMKGGSNTNVIPSYAEAYIDFRVATMDEAEKVTSTIENIKPFNPLTKIKVTGGLSRAPLERNEKNQELYRLAIEAGKKIGLKVTEGSAGGISDGNFTSAIGIPTLDGLGIPGDGAHALHEHIDFDLFPERAALISQLCVEIGTKVNQYSYK